MTKKINKPNTKQNLSLKEELILLFLRKKNHDLFEKLHVLNSMKGDFRAEIDGIKHNLSIIYHSLTSKKKSIMDELLEIELEFTSLENILYEERHS